MARIEFLNFVDGVKEVTKGDIIELVTGEKITFVEMKRTKWSGQLNGKGVLVPLYRSKFMATMENSYAKALVGKDDSVITKSFDSKKLKFGDLFYIEGHKEAFMYISEKEKKGKVFVWARDLASKRTFTIEPAMTIVKIDLNQLKEEHK